jgi:hypothetical protein
MFMDVSEGVVLESCVRYAGHPECGGLYGDREVFKASIGYKFGDNHD